MYYEEHGNPQGRPVVVLHGGPGGGLKKKSIRFFDKRKWRIILYDQRGCGKSKPRLSLLHNTTWDLVEDIERLRKHLEIPKWTVTGGSWGSTLALAYASKHLDKSEAFVLNGICLITPEEMRWIYEKDGAAQLYPTNWERFYEPVAPAKDYKTLTRKYRSLFKSNKTRRSAAKEWSRWEMSLARLKQIPFKSKHPNAAEEISMIENHYFIHDAWLKPGELLEAAKKIDVPLILIQGRHDTVCPAKSAIILKEAVPQAKLILVPEGGHSTKESAMAKALKQAIQSLI
jgi:proline iminopeptidase